MSIALTLLLAFRKSLGLQFFTFAKETIVMLYS